MSPEDQTKYCTDNKVRSMLPKIITTGYTMLHLITFFTCGADEVKAWTVHVSFSQFFSTSRNPYAR